VPKPGDSLPPAPDHLPAPTELAKVAEREDHDPAVVDVHLVAVGDREVEVRLADGRPGVVARADFDKAGLGTDRVGTSIRAATLTRDDPKGRVAMSAAWAVQSDAWHAAEQAKADHLTLTGRVVKQIKGGLLVDLGVRAFLPHSMIGEVAGGVEKLVGTDVEVLVHEIDRSGDRLVVSRRDVQRRERRAEEKAAWSAVSKGQRRSGRVVAVEDYGAKVDLDPLRGLVHRSELSWSHFDHPSEVVKVGDQVEVVVLDVNKSRRRIGLSLRQASAHPFDAIEVGQVCTGTVLRVVEYGAFVRIEGGAEGLVHLSELSEMPASRADHLVAPGEEVRVKVLSFDRERNRMALSARQALYEP